MNTLGKMMMRCCLLFCLLVAFVACSSKKQGESVTASDSIVAMLKQDIPEPLKGSWEMSAIKDPSLRGQMEDVDGIVYSMELNLSERLLQRTMTCRVEMERVMVGWTSPMFPVSITMI